jgi:hypothetical protein
MRYENDGEIERLVASFEDATIERGVWKHAEHLVVALYYVNKFGDVDAATDKMRDGLFNLLTEGFKVDLSKEMPYHETLTVFWMKTIDEFSRSTNGMSLHEKANNLIETFDKDYPLNFYTREYLFSDDARARFVEPDFLPAANSDDNDRRQS